MSYFTEPIYFSSIILGSLYHADHLSRAMYQRITEIEDLPQPFSLNRPLLSGERNTALSQITPFLLICHMFSTLTVLMGYFQIYQGICRSFRSLKSRFSLLLAFMYVWRGVIQRKLTIFSIQFLSLLHSLISKQGLKCDCSTSLKKNQERKSFEISRNFAKWLWWRPSVIKSYVICFLMRPQNVQFELYTKYK